MDSSAWLSVPLEDYEGHMTADEVGQLPVLAELFQYVVRRWCPESVALLGIAGGNGLEAIDPAVAKRTVGIDINQQYLDVVKRRFGSIPGLELHVCDLSKEIPEIAPVGLVHAALLFEHAGLGATLDNALSLGTPGCIVSVVLQMPTAEAQDVAATSYTSIQALKHGFTRVDVAQFQREMASRGLRLVGREMRPLPGGKAFWLGVFQREF
jgi:hypothetical protein